MSARVRRIVAIPATALTLVFAGMGTAASGVALAAPTHPPATVEVPAEDGIDFRTAGGGVTSPPVSVGKHLYVSTGSTIAARNTARKNPAPPARTGTDPENGSISGLATSNGYLYAATLGFTSAPDIGVSGGGISTYALTRPAHPSRVAQTDLPAAFGYGSTPHMIAATRQALYAIDQYGGVFAYSLDDPAAPGLVSTTKFTGNFYSFLNQGNSITVRGDELILTGFTDNGDGRYLAVLIYDISDPFAPTVAGNRILDGDGFGPAFAESNSVTVTQDGYAVMVGFRFAIFDLRDPADIHLVYGAIDYPRQGVTGAAAVVRGDYAYVATAPLCTFGNCGGGGVLGTDVWDISTPSAPELVETAPLDLSPLTYNGAANSPTGPVFVGADNRVTVLDVRVPDAPVVDDEFALVTSAGRVDTLATEAVFHDHLAYLVGGSNGFSVVRPRTLKPVGRFDSTEGLIRPSNSLLPPAESAIALEGERAYLLDTSGFSIVDIEDPTRPTRLAHVEIPAAEGVGQVAVDAGVAYLTTATTLRLFDVSDPASPVLVSTVPGFYAVSGLEIRGSDLFLTSQTDVQSPNYLYILDVTDAAAPIEVARFAPCDSPDYTPDRLDVSADGNLAYLADRGCGQVDVVDTTDKTAPEVIGTYTPPGEFNSVNEVTLARNRMYVGTGFGVDLVDISTPAEPAQLERYAPLPSTAARASRAPSGILFFFSYRSDGLSVYREDAAVRWS